jgi:hypothetical protein
LAASAAHQERQDAGLGDHGDGDTGDGDRGELAAVEPEALLQQVPVEVVQRPGLAAGTRRHHAPRSTQTR